MSHEAPATDIQVKRSVAVAARKVLARGKTLTLGRLIAAGARGGDTRIMEAAKALEKKGVLPECARTLRKATETIDDAPVSETEKMLRDYHRAAKRIGLEKGRKGKR
jgi:hypothetical protein